MDAGTALVILLTIIIPILALFLKDRKPARGQKLNIFIVIAIIFTYFPFLKALLTNKFDDSGFMLIITVPVGGIILIILCILKLVYKKPKAPKEIN